MIKRKYLAACLVAALFVAGCGSNSAEKKETTETTEETKTSRSNRCTRSGGSASEEDAQDETAADDSGEADDSTDEDEQDLTDAEEDEDTGLEEEDLSKVVPADSLVQDADKYVTLGETRRIWRLFSTHMRSPMISYQDQIDSELSEKHLRRSPQTSLL